MKAITYDEKCYRVGGKATYLNSGEFHYFRVPRKDWVTRMRLMKEAGGNCVATYMPWLLHEAAEGKFEFGGELLDFEGFVETAQKEGLYVIARPGPYQYSELKYSGLPGWLVENHPELLGRDLQGGFLVCNCTRAVSYIHPKYEDYVRKWYDKVCPIIAKHTASKGGPVAFTQFDNEMPGLHIWSGSLDYNEESMGFGKSEGRWTKWLRERYKDVAALNESWGTKFGTFEEARPMAPGWTAKSAEVRHMKDYYEFYYSTVIEHARFLIGMMREHGIDTPIVHNSCGPKMNAMFEPMIEQLGKGFVLGSDHYYTLGQTWSQNNPTPGYAAQCFFSLEMLRLKGFPPTVFELPGGNLSDWPPITAQDARTCYLMNLALGMKGHNYYIFTGGPNPPGVGITSDVYDYCAGIGAFGEVRPLYQAQKDLGDVIAKHPWLAEAEREADCRITMDLELTRSEYYWKRKGETLLHGSEAWDLTWRGPLMSAMCAGLSLAFCDMTQDNWVGDTSTPVIVWMSSAMGAAKQKRVVEFIKKGGRAMLGPVIPTLDENLRPCTILRDFLGAGEVRECDSPFKRLNVAGVENPYCNKLLFLGEPPKGAETVGVEENSGGTAAWRKRYGKGEVIWMGMAWHHAMREHEAMITRLMEMLGLERKVTCSNPNIWTSLRTSGKKSVLFVMNLLTAPMETELEAKPAWSGKMIKLGKRKLAGISVEVIEVLK